MPTRLRTLVHLFADRVTVDDKETVLALVGQEGFADPAQVGGRLFGQGDARPNARVHEQIVAGAEGVVEAAQEFDMGRKGGADGLEGRAGAILRSRSGSVP